MIMPVLPWALALSAVAAPAVGHAPRTIAAPTVRKDVQGCRMIVPTDLGTGGAVRWIGACVQGLAGGAGVLRVDRGAGDVALFAGTMRKGRPVAGYLDTGSEATAGPVLRFDGADGLPTADRNEAGRACAVAAAGASAASDCLRAAGNHPSARFYDGWARTLRRCR